MYACGCVINVTRLLCAEREHVLCPRIKCVLEYIVCTMKVGIQDIEDAYSFVGVIIIQVSR